MNLIPRGVLILAYAACFSRPVAAQPTPEQAAVMEDASRLRRLTMGIILYTHEHGDQLPADLHAISPYLTGDLSKVSAAEREDAFRKSYMTGEDQAVRVPREVDAGWLKEHSSYSYLAGPDFKVDDLAGWDRVAVAHLKFDKGLVAEPGPFNPDGRLYSVAFLDSHIELMPREEAEAVVAESIAVFEALKSGKSLPDAHQVLMDLRVVGEAIRAYAAKHGDRLPPSLGATLEHIPESKRLAKPADRAGVFLSPSAKKTTHVPDEPTPEWVNERTSWVYLGDEGARMADLEDPRGTILVHGKFDATMQTRNGQQGLPVLTALGNPRLEPEEYTRWIAGISKKVVESARSGTPLPEHLNAFRDTRLILQGLFVYAKEHGGMLPPDLGSALPYILQDGSAADRARVFLSPARERRVEPPAEVTAEWVNANSSYTYLAPGSVDLNLVREAGGELLIHGPMNEPYDIMVPHAQVSAVATGMSFNYVWMSPAPDAERRAMESAETLKALYAGTTK